jgi:L-threonylcarbamoyladenylate synthase
MAVIPATPQNIRSAAQSLRAGGVVAFPTETVYGLGALALNARAAARIFEIKERPSFDPLIVHVGDEDMLALVARGISPLARELMRRFWPGALTIVLPRGDAVPRIVTAGLPSVAVRMPSHPVALALLRETGAPIAAPSANRFGGLTPTRAQHVEKMLGQRVECILDAGPTQLGVESTIVRLDPRPALLRPGAIAAEEIEAIAGPLERSVDERGAPLAPGRLAHHYAPSTPLRVVASAGVPAAERQGSGYLAFQHAPQGYAAVRVLSASGDLGDAAARLFDLLHELDALGLERIDAEPVPERGLGLAIMDRLRRAAA